jgi:hypothetical protein
MKKASELRTDLRLVISDTATGSPDKEIGYNQFIFIDVPEEVDMVTYQQTEVVPRS